MSIQLELELGRAPRPGTNADAAFQWPENGRRGFHKQKIGWFQ